MADYKVGDKVYYFWHSNDCSLVWHLCDFNVRQDTVTEVRPDGRTYFDKGYMFDPTDAFYKTRNEAIDAMIQHLERLIER